MVGWKAPSLKHSKYVDGSVVDVVVFAVMARRGTISILNSSNCWTCANDAIKFGALSIDDDIRHWNWIVPILTRSNVWCGVVCCCVVSASASLNSCEANNHVQFPAIIPYVYPPKCTQYKVQQADNANGKEKELLTSVHRSVSCFFYVVLQSVYMAWLVSFHSTRRTIFSFSPMSCWKCRPFTICLTMPAAVCDLYFFLFVLYAAG